MLIMAKRILSLITVLGAGLLVPQACATEPEPDAGPPAETAPLSVDILLSGYEYVPKAEDWARVGAAGDVAQELMGVADDTTAASFKRSRALSSLSHFPSTAVETYLGQRALDTKLAPGLRGKAVIAWAIVGKDAAAPTIAELLASPDAGLRENAVRALKTMRAEAVEGFLTNRVSSEPVPHIQDALRTAAANVKANRAALVTKKLSVPTVVMRPVASVPTAKAPGEAPQGPERREPVQR